MPEQMKKKVVITAGKPLRVDIVTFYSGNVWGGETRKKDLLITSFRKLGNDSGQGLRGIHYHEPKVEKNKTTFPSAGDTGSGLIYFDPFLSSEKVKLEIDVLSKNPNFEGIGKAGELVKTAGGMIPFAQVSGLLITGGKLLSLGANIAKHFSRDKVEFNTSFEISDGLEVPELEFLFPSGNIEEHSNEFEIFSSGIQPPRLVHKADPNKFYAGDTPYIILRFTSPTDSKELESLKNYHNQIETLVNLSRFIGDGKKPVDLKDIQGGISSILDLRHFQGILKTLKEVEADSKDSEKNVEKVQELLKRLELIQNEDLKDILSEKVKKHQTPES
jgi:hypothetical protein